MYRVIVPFFDLEDEGYSYHIGDEYPRKGKEVRDGRINALLTGKNKRGVPLIKKSEEPEVVQNERAINTGNAKIKPRNKKQHK